MGRPRYEISAEDHLAAEGWIGRHLLELPPEAAQALRGASSPADLQSVVDLFFSAAQRRRLHGAIRQTRNRDRKKSISVTLDGKTADELYQLSEWTGQPPARILQDLIFSKWNETCWTLIRRTERETGRTIKFDEIIKAKSPELISALLLKAGQKLDK
ncbi:MAG: hypothetical protein KKG88_10475 [Proteobacteria bacterium]|nr:hypothetical protein [Pseudomonadota bacterium]